MAERKHGDEYAIDPPGSGTGRSGGERFKREGPEPAPGDTGRTVEEMNEKAGDSVIRNITPDEATD